MDLEKLVTEESESLSGWVEFKDGFSVHLKHVDRKTIQDIRAKCTRTVWRNHQPVQEMDQERMVKALAAFVLGWRGLTPEVLRKLFPVREEALKGVTEVPCTEENKVFLLLRAYDFDTFVFERITEVEALREKQRDAELKNSAPLSQPA